MDIEIKPKEWILPNRIKFNNYIYKTFNINKYPDLKLKKKLCKCEDNICAEEDNNISLFVHQRIVRDFIQYESPYRGILLYHELGSGKSAASIASAECFIEKKKIVVLTPASLSQNYENEIIKMSKSGLNMRKSWSKILLPKILKDEIKKGLKKYGITEKIIKSDNIVWIPLYKKDIDGISILKDNIGYKSLLVNEKEKIDETVIHIIRNKYTFISYNGITQNMIKNMGNKFFNNTFIIIDEVHNFISRIVNGSKLLRIVYNNIMIAENCKMVLLSGTPIINNPYEIATLINILRGPMYIYNIKLLTNSIEPDNIILKKELKKTDYLKYIDYIYYKNNKINIVLLPIDYVRYKKKEIIKEEWKKSEEKIIEEIIKKLKNINNLKLGVKFIKNLSQSLPNSRDEFNKLFLDFTNEENPIVMNKDLFKRRILGTVSYYRTSGTEFFPYQFPIKIQYLDMTNHQLMIYEEIRVKERAMEKLSSKGNNLFGEKSSVYRAYSRMICNFAFPDNLKRLFPQDIRKILKNEIDIIDDDTDNDIKIDNKTVYKEYDDVLNNLIKNLVDGDYLLKENLINNYSPKYAKMLEDIENSPGSVLVYSQFRSIEGLGIFSKVLNKYGYKEIIIIKTDNGYKFEDLSIFDEIYDNKRYVIFNSDREKTNILLHLFNGEYKLLREYIYKLLPERIKNPNFQLYGKLAKIMMITQSGAEGISLKNVRRVLIMEYFWNSVRIDQVIGRAVRTCSHELLPFEERNVEIFGYIMRLTNEQLKKNFTIKNLDKGITTDEYILNIANKKEIIIKEFLTMLKSSSIDCIINSKQNRPLENNYKCYNWPINVNNKRLSYTNDINDENMILKHKKYEKLKKNKGKIVEINKIKYVELNKKLYDYYSYIYAGILINI